MKIELIEKLDNDGIWYIVSRDNGKDLPDRKFFKNRDNAEIEYQKALTEPPLSLTKKSLNLRNMSLFNDPFLKQHLRKMNVRGKPSMQSWQDIIESQRKIAEATKVLPAPEIEIVCEPIKLIIDEGSN